MDARSAVEPTYLYGITDKEDVADIDMNGLDAAGPVYVLGHGGIGAVVSEYIGEPLSSLPMDKILRYLLHQQQVVERIMGRHTVLPVKFGVLLDNPQAVCTLLARERAKLVDALALVKDMVEIEVAATWDVGRALEDASRDEEIVRAKGDITDRGEPGLDDQLRLGQLVKASLDRRRKAYRERMVDFLGPFSVAVAPNALVSDELVMNTAFWVKRDGWQEFERRIQDLDEMFQREITFRVIGPLPSYSFSTVEVTRITSQQLEEACQVFGLEEGISAAKVRRAYRRLAAQAQRSLRLNGGSSDSGFVAGIKGAYELLLRYCRAQESPRQGLSHQRVAIGQGEPFFTLEIKGSRNEEIDPSTFGAAEPLIGRKV